MKALQGKEQKNKQRERAFHPFLLFRGQSKPFKDGLLNALIDVSSSKRSSSYKTLPHETRQHSSGQLLCYGVCLVCGTLPC